MSLTEYFNQTLKCQLYFNDPEISLNMNDHIINNSINCTMATYMRGELNDLSIHGENKVNGVNYMEPLIASLS